jgi:hypothetical protein
MPNNSIFGQIIDQAAFGILLGKPIPPTGETPMDKKVWGKMRTPDFLPNALPRTIHAIYCLACITLVC